MFPAAIVASEANSLSGSDEGGANKGTNTDELESNARGTDQVIQAHQDTGVVEGNDSPEDRTLREIFDRDKATALDCAERLGELVPDIELDDEFERGSAMYDNRPMLSLALAKELCVALENIESVKLIMAKEKWT